MQTCDILGAEAPYAVLIITLLETRIAQLLSMMDKPLETEQKG